MKNLCRMALLCIAILIISEYARAQWTQTNGPFGGAINGIAASGQT
jgi:hypothetical protein